MESCAAVVVFHKSNGGLNSDSLSHSLCLTHTHTHTCTHSHTHTHTHAHMHTCTVFEGSSVFCGASGSWTMGRQKEGWFIWRAGLPVYYCNAPLSLLPASSLPFSLPTPPPWQSSGKIRSGVQSHWFLIQISLHSHPQYEQGAIAVCLPFISIFSTDHRISVFPSSFSPFALPSPNVFSPHHTVTRRLVARGLIVT